MKLKLNTGDMADYVTPRSAITVYLINIYGCIYYQIAMCRKLDITLAPLCESLISGTWQINLTVILGWLYIARMEQFWVCVYGVE